MTPPPNAPSATNEGEVTGGTVMARQLATEGVTHVFGIPGVQLDYATNGLSQFADELEFIVVRHEQTTTYAADGYARTTGRIGAALVVPGPGVLNAGAGLVTARACSSPVLLIAGQIPSRGIGLDLGMLHEIPDQTGLLASLCRQNTLVTDPGQIAGVIHGAVVALGQGPGPISVEIPPDVLHQLTAGAAVGAEPAGSPSPGAAADIGNAVERLSAAERPVIYVGGGACVAEAWHELHRLAEALGAPLVASSNGKGAFDDRHPLAVLPLGHKELLQRADTILMIGTRGLDPRGRPVATSPEATLISLNRDPAAFGQPRSFDVTVTGDARTGAAALADELGDARPPWCDDLEDIRAWIARELEPIEPQAAYARALRTAMPDDAVLVNELTQVGYAGRQMFEVRHPRSYLDPGYQGTLGYGYPTAVGAAVGNPDRPVVSVNGDGGFGYGLAEMATVAQYGLPLVGVVFSDGAYGNVRRMHIQQFDGVHHGTDLTNPDYLSLAASFGLKGYRATSPAELADAASRAIDAREPALIDVPVGEFPDPWAIVGRPWAGRR